MKKEFSFYEFVGLIVPSVFFLYVGQLIWIHTGHIELIDFSRLGDTACFIIVSYAVGHFIQALGNYFEWIVWKIFKGMPTKWIVKENLFKRLLFDTNFNKKVLEKLSKAFGELSDYGQITYNYLVTKNINVSRIDIFNASYSLYRGLVISVSGLLILSCFFLSWKFIVLVIAVDFILFRRMIRFAKYYAKEIYRTFYNQEQ